MTLGEHLKQARESLNLTVEHAAVLTKIQKKYLICLEDDRYENLPPAVYTVGFLKRYAKILQLDADEIINQYKEERGGEVLEMNAAGQVRLAKKNSKPLITPKIVSFFVVLLVGASIFLFFRHQFKFLFSPPRLVLEDPAHDFITQDERLTLKGVAEEGVEVEVNGRKLELSPEGKFYDYIYLTAGLNVVEIKAVNRFGKSNVVNRKIIFNQ